MRQITSPFRKAGRTLRQHPAGTLGAITAVVVFCWDRLNDFLSGTSLMEGMLGPQWVEKTVHSPWFTLAGLTACFGFLGWIGHRAEQAEKIETGHRAQLLRDAMEIPILVTQARSLRSEVQGLRNAIARAAREADRYENDMQLWLGTTPFEMYQEKAFGRYPIRNPMFGLFTGFSWFQVPDWHPQIAVPEPAYAYVKKGGGEALLRFDPSANEAFQKNLALYIHQIRTYIDQLEELAGEQDKQLSALDKIIDDKVRSRGIEPNATF